MSERTEYTPPGTDADECQRADLSQVRGDTESSVLGWQAAALEILQVCIFAAESVQNVLWRRVAL
jgi:hypothetical protein